MMEIFYRMNSLVLKLVIQFLAWIALNCLKNIIINLNNLSFNSDLVYEFDIHF